jgi:hypothetical protein
MQIRNLHRALCLGVIVFAVSTSSNANSYNAGFIAAESGDYQQAVSEWKPLADEGHPVAQFNMALLYHSGDGVELDEGRAVSLYHKAAEQGYDKAQEYLAVGYQEGWFGLPKDQQKADYWNTRLQAGH